METYESALDALVGAEAHPHTRHAGLETLSSIGVAQELSADVQRVLEGVPMTCYVEVRIVL